MIHTGDCIEIMATLPESSVDAVVTDPPYGLEFMGKEWDRLWNDKPHGEDNHLPTDEAGKSTGLSRWTIARPQYRAGSQAQAWHEQWATAALRVAKPGAYLLAFGGTRTVHRMTCAIEDAGWIIRDLLIWGYAQGFPKSKASLKPAWEPIVLARKPGPLRELQVDAARIAYVSEAERAEVNARTGPNSRHREQLGGGVTGSMTKLGERHVDDVTHPSGRWPANVVLTDPVLDGGWEGVVGGGDAPAGDTGTYSRFFMVPKASRSDREPILSDLPTAIVDIAGLNKPEQRAARGVNPDYKPRQNTHPTVKPLALMRHLVRLATPPQGTVLDPFLGSGTTAVAAEMEGFDWIGIEREAEYVAIAEARLGYVQRGLGMTA